MYSLSASRFHVYLSLICWTLDHAVLLKITVSLTKRCIKNRVSVSTLPPSVGSRGCDEILREMLTWRKTLMYLKSSTTFTGGSTGVGSVGLLSWSPWVPPVAIGRVSKWYGSMSESVGLLHLKYVIFMVTFACHIAVDFSTFVVRIRHCDVATESGTHYSNTELSRFVFLVIRYFVI